MSTFDQVADHAEPADEQDQEPGPPLFDKWIIRSLFVFFVLATLSYAVDVFVTSVYLTWGKHLWSEPLELTSLYAQAIYPLILAYLLLLALGFRGYFQKEQVQKRFSLGFLNWGALGLVASLWKLEKIWSMQGEQESFFQFNASVQLSEGYPYLADLIWLDGLGWALFIGAAGYLFSQRKNPQGLSQAKSTGALGLCLWILLLSRTTHSLSFLIGALVIYLLFVSRLKTLLSSLEKAEVAQQDSGRS